MNTFMQDVRHAFRGLLKRPGFTVVAVSTLALGIGANAAIFSVVNAVILRPLPYPDPERLMVVGPTLGAEVDHVGEPLFLFTHEHQKSFVALALYQAMGSGINLSSGGADISHAPEFVDGLRVSREFFDVVGLKPAIGRSFVIEEDQPGGESVAIVTYELWQRRFGGDPSVVGKPVTINGREHTVVGVLQRGFQFFNDADVFVPFRPSLRGDRDPNALMIGRMKSEVTVTQARADLRLVTEQYRAANPRGLRDNEILSTQGAQDYIAKDVRGLLFILLAAVSFVLLIACANVANLQLARAVDRRKELAVRLALGSGFRRITRLLLIDGILLAGLGGLTGLLLATWGVDFLKSFIPDQAIPILGEIALDSRVVLFTLGASVLTGLIFGLAPLSQILRIDLNHALKEGAGKGGAQPRGRLRSVLVISEIALAVVLLIGAALLIRTFANLNKIDPGFDPNRLLTFQVTPMGAQYSSGGQIAAFYQGALERIRGLPGVEAAAVTSTLPLSSQFRMPVEVSGRDPIAESVQLRVVSPDYFRTMRMPVLRGRSFAEPGFSDTAGSEPVIIVNDAFAQKYINREDPLSERVAVGRQLEPGRKLLGIVGNNKQFGLDSDSPPTVFIPIAQTPERLWPVLRRFVSMRFVARATGEPLSLVNGIREAVAAIDPGLPVTKLRSMDEIIQQSVSSERFNMMLLGLFAALGLVLTAIGVYGVMSYLVSQRTREVGIRLALGAQTKDVFNLVIGEGMRLAALGVVVGLLASLALARVITGLLFGVSATDPATFAVISTLILGVAFLACWMPARKATSVDPLVALRCE